MTKIRVWGLAIAFVAAAALVGVGAAPQAPGGQPPDPAAVQTRSLADFSGTPIDVDFQSVNLRTVLRTLAEIGGVNLVVDPSVPATATVDLKLTQVPWNKVMDVVLKSDQLTYVLDGNVLRVLTQKALTDEYTAEAEKKRASERAPDLETERIRLNYATAKDMVDLLKKMGFGSESSRGSVEYEERTNMLVIKETPRNLAEIRRMMTDIDRPEAQVSIEAQIVQTNSDTAKALGIQWGVNGRVAPELGNTTSLAFPNNGSVGGRVVSQGNVTQGPADGRASKLEQLPSAVNLPVAGASTALGLSMGAINGAFGLDVALSALQHEGKAKILSRPTVTTQNNKQAEITQGFEVPFQTVTNNTITIQFRDAALKLTVTPQITAANTVIMNITLENGTPDFSRAVNGNPSINTQRASTQVQVNDGVTTVIGGILQTQENYALDSTPGAAKIPLLGWLFKRTNNVGSSQELMIFITPRIIRG